MNFLQYIFFNILVFGHKACGILVPRWGIESVPPALEGEVLTTGPLKKSLQYVIKLSIHCLSSAPTPTQGILAYNYRLQKPPIWSFLFYNFPFQSKLNLKIFFA